MIPYQRKKFILEKISSRNITYLDEIYSWFENISESTLRRDLKSLENEGKVELLRGGGVKGIYHKVDDIPNEIKKSINIEKKEQIAKYAASLINDGDVIYLDTGTTCLFILDFINDEKKITIVTANVDIINRVRHNSLDNIKLIFIGGEFDTVNGALSGTLAEENLSKLYFDKAFIGGTSINYISGVSTPELKEAKKKQIAKLNSRESYCLIDSSKFDKFSMCSVLPLDVCNVITDKYDSLLEKCKSYIIAK